MKDLYRILEQKESDLARVRREIESLQIVAPLLSDDPVTQPPASEGAADNQLEATGTDVFSACVARIRQEGQSKQDSREDS